MPYGRRHESLKRKVEEIIKDEIKSEIQLKRQITGFDLSAASTNNVGAFIDFSTIAQGNVATSLQDDRIGAQVKAKSLRLRFYIQSIPSAVAATQATLTNALGFILAETCLRVIIFSWLPYGPLNSSPGAILDLGDSPGAGYEITAPHLQQRGASTFKIHSDRTYNCNSRYLLTWNGTLYGAAAIPEIFHVDETIFPEHTIDYQTSTSGANAIGHIGMYVFSNEPSNALSPRITGQAALYYTDA